MQPFSTLLQLLLASNALQVIAQSASPTLPVLVPTTTASIGNASNILEFPICAVSRLSFWTMFSTVLMVLL